MKALVTGSAGFVGRHMVAELRRRGYWVGEIDLKTGMDALDYFRAAKTKYDLIVHCAYQVGGREAIDGINMNLATNVQLDGAMFNYALRTSSERVLYFSSSAAYPVHLQDGMHELRLHEADMHDYVNPDANYGWAKITGERMAEQAKKLGLNVHVVRPFSGYGEDQGDEYPFPSICRRAAQADYSVWGPPHQVRDWIHIDDIVGACFAIMEANYQHPVNLCTGHATSMATLLKMAAMIANGDFVADCEIDFQLDKPTGVLHRVGDPTLMNQFYTPKVTLVEGVLRMIETL